MRALKATILAVVLLGAFGLISDAAGNSRSRTTSGIEAGVADRLRRCGPMHYGEPRTDCVTTLQHFLRARGAPLPASGNYLAGTTKHLKQFQATRNLRIDGVLDQATLKALTDLPGEREWDLRSDCVSLGPAGRDQPASQGACVAALRDRLAAAGLNGGRGDTLDAATAATVRTFQQRVGLPAIGVVGPQTKKALYGAPSGTAGSTGSACASDACTVYLSRGTTRDLADAYPDNRLARILLASAIGALACHRVRAVLGPNIICQATATYILDTVVDALDRAAARNACVAIRIGHPPHDRGWAPLRIRPYDGPKCLD